MERCQSDGRSNVRFVPNKVWIGSTLPRGTGAARDAHCLIGITDVA